ncbi:polyprotein [parechovirus D1]|uniref:Genome polyprotein n=1 Tax=parechovirus D1 TaxID=1394142 RepID=T1YD22_9PICO|nr:polyprotein [parechovirus D1]AGU62957.1 polyprotein [parechovirus D1]
MDTIATLMNKTGTLLNNPEKEFQEQNSDRMAAASTANAGNLAQAAVKPAAPLDAGFKNSDSFTSMSYSTKTFAQNIAKLVPVANANWLNSHGRSTELFAVQLPSGLYRDGTFPAQGISKYFKYVRTAFHFCLQVTVPQGAAGSLILCYLPRAAANREPFDFDSYTNLPSVVLNLATGTQADLFIPYTNHKNFAATNSNDLGTVYCFVWTPLGTPTGAPADVEVNLLACLVNPNFQCPIPTNEGPVRDPITKFKWTREVRDIAEGPGTMNLANRLETNGARSLALVGERAHYDPYTAGVKHRIVDLMQYARLPSVVNSGIFDWNGTTAPRTSIWKTNIQLAQIPNLKWLSECFQYFRGSLVISMSVYSSMFNRGRLRLCWYPLHADDFSYVSSRNAINVVCDIGLNNTFELTLPFTSDSWMKHTGETLGRITVFNETKLTYNSASVNTVKCVVSMKAGPDFTMMSPKETLHSLQAPTSWGSEMDLTDPLDDSTDGVKEVEGAAAFQSSTCDYSQADDAAEDTGLAAKENAGTLNEVVQAKPPKFINFDTCKRHIYTISHTRVDNFFGRAQRIAEFAWSDKALKSEPLSWPNHNHQAMARLFAYFAGEINLHLVNESDKHISVGHTYDLRDGSSDYGVSSSGVMVIPPQTAMSMCCPWYSHTPFRPTRALSQSGIKPLGTIWFKPEAESGTLIVYLSLRNPNFVFPLPSPKTATASSLSSQDDALFCLYSAERLSDILSALEVSPDEPFVPPQNSQDNSLSMRMLRRLGYRRELLKQCGDVEENPGPFPNRAGNSQQINPTMHHAWLVYRDRGIYKHYGVQCGDSVYHLETEDIIDAALAGKAVFTCEPADSSWTRSQPLELDYFTQVYLDASVGSEHIFSARTNCETIVRDMFPNIPGISQSQALGLAGLILVSASTLGLCAASFSAQELRDMLNLSFQQNSDGYINSLVQKAMSYFSSILCETLAADIIKTIIKYLVRLFCYIVMYCHAPNLMTTMCMSTLLVLDVTDAKQLSSDTTTLFKGLLEGDIKGFCERIVHCLQFDTTEEETELKLETLRQAERMLSHEFDTFVGQTNESPIKEFNAFTTASKNVSWWLGIFKQIIMFFKNLFSPNSNARSLQWLADHEGQICDLLATCNNHIIDMKKPENQRDPRFHDKHKWLCRRLTDVATIVYKSATYSPLATQVLRLNAEMAKIRLTQPSSGNMVRQEPVGVWICGDPGQGKSFFAHALIKAVQKKTKLVGIFTNPTGSDFMDGYAHQDIHIIDDAGQNREEKDLALLCQCISSVPFTVPMADLCEKGIQYTSKLVIATSNRTDFTTVVLSDHGALARRFPVYLRIRAKQQFQKNGKIDTAAAMIYMKTGEPWEVSTDGYKWSPCNMDEIATTVANDIIRKHDAVSAWTNMMEEDEGPIVHQDVYDMCLNDITADCRRLDDICQKLEADLNGLDSPFEALRKRSDMELDKAPTTVISWFRKKLTALRNWCQRNVGWLSLVSVLTTGASMLATYLILRKPDPPAADNRAYNPQTTNPKGKSVFTMLPNQPVVTQVNQSPYNGEIEHCMQATAYITGKNVNYPLHCIAWKQRYIVTYGHIAEVLPHIDCPQLWYKGNLFEIEEAEMSYLSSNGGPMDLLLIHLPKFPIQFKDITKYISNGISKEAYLIFSTPMGRMMYEVKNPYLSGFHQTLEGTKNSETITYCLNTKKGMCGGLLITKIDGNFQIAGLHISGNGVVGSSAMLKVLKQSSNQGVIIETTTSPVRVFQPGKTQIHPSPLHGLWDVKMEPAVLSAHDPRLEVECTSVVKMCSNDKYVGNVFSVDMDIFKMAMSNVLAKLYRQFGTNKTVSMEKAIVGFGKFNRIDLATSPGIKYSLKYKKRDLIQYDPLVVHKVLVEDVQKTFEDVKSGCVQTVFATHLKDELRKLPKIKSGSTRVIEACSLDYVIVHRMIMGEIYEKIYATAPQLTGFAVGMNPWTDFDMLVRSLHDNVYCFDFRQWDGSLPPELMDAGVWVLSGLHEDPSLVRNLMAPVITSEQICLDAKHLVYGGMPSGAPCTTVLNTVCNLLACEYASLKIGAESLCVAYGDDLLFSTPVPINPVHVLQIWKCDLGLTATGPDKTEHVPAVCPLDIEFLKRTPKFFPNSGFIVGALDLDNMLQHIMWSHSSEAFLQQLSSFENELVLHGEHVYNEVQSKVNKHLSKMGMNMLPFNVVYNKMVQLVFE